METVRKIGLEGAFLVIAATDDESVNARVARMPRHATSWLMW